MIQYIIFLYNLAIRKTSFAYRGLWPSSLHLVGIRLDKHKVNSRSWWMASLCLKYRDVFRKGCWHLCFLHELVWKSLVEKINLNSPQKCG